MTCYSSFAPEQSVATTLSQTSDRKIGVRLERSSTLGFPRDGNRLFEIHHRVRVPRRSMLELLGNRPAGGNDRW